MWKIMKTLYGCAIWQCKIAKHLVSLDRFIAWSPLVFRPGSTKDEDEDEDDCPFPDGTAAWSGSTNQNWQGGRPAWDQDKVDSDPDFDVDPDSDS